MHEAASAAAAALSLDHHSVRPTPSVVLRKENDPMSKRALIRSTLAVLSVTMAFLLIVLPHVVELKSADHREAPLISEDPPADIADVYTFVNPSDTNRVVFAMTVNGFAVPAVRGTYSFSNDVLYQFKIDNDGDADEDLVIQAIFSGYESVRHPRCPANESGQGGQLVTVLGPAKPKKTGAVNELLRGKGVPVTTGCSNTVIDGALGIKVFAGLRDDPFVVDIGQFNRILGGTQEAFRDVTVPVLGNLRGRPVRNGRSGVDSFGGFNVSALVVELPKAMVQGSRRRTATYLKTNTTIGFWGTTSRSGGDDDKDRDGHGRDEDRGPFIQIQRMGHQVVKTVFIPTNVRDFFNGQVPRNDADNFKDFFPDALTTTDTDGRGNTIAGRAVVLDVVKLTALPNGAPLLLPPTFANTDPDLIRNVLLPDVLRIDLSLTPTELFVGANGYQNGRRLVDDVIDIVLRVARQLADVKFPDALGIPGSGPLGTRKALDCSTFPCKDRRVFAVLQGTDFIEPDGEITELKTNGTDRAVSNVFPYFASPHPLPGEPGTVGFPPQE
jgi:hypothetical protein